MSECPLCLLGRGNPCAALTTWFRLTSVDYAGRKIKINAVRDLHDRGHTMRILVTTELHVHINNTPPELWGIMREFGQGVAEAQSKLRGLRITGRDEVHFSFPGHSHVQYLLDP